MVQRKHEQQKNDRERRAIAETHDHDGGEAAIAATGGAVAGGAIGAAIGALGGPVGVAIGAAIGAPIGAAIGEAVGWEDHEEEFHDHFNALDTPKSLPWSKAQTAYRYGWDNAGRRDLHGRTFDESKEELARGFEPRRGKFKYAHYEPMIQAGWDRRARADLEAGREAVVPIVEEELRVGKRKVETGGVKLRTRVEERPVEEKVRLHEEHIEVERRPADRAASAGERAAAFRGGSLEMAETSEEAVVTKRPKVIEEVVIRKEGRDRTETIRDSARRTDVDIKQADLVRKVAPWETFEPGCRVDFDRRYAGRGSTYDNYSPAYRFGYDLAGAHGSRTTWREVEPEARRRWEERNPGTWEQFKDAIRHAWNRVIGTP